MLIDVKHPSLNRLDVPHEPGEWIEIRRLAWSQLGNVSTLFRNAIVAWSYPVAPSALVPVEGKAELQPATDCLDDTTAAWLLEQINRWNHPTRTEQQRSDSISPSTVS
jgi:hypothetical protein